MWRVRVAVSVRDEVNTLNELHHQQLCCVAAVECGV